MTYRCLSEKVTWNCPNTILDYYRFLLRALKDFGYGKQSMETLILEDVNMLCNMIRDKMLDVEIDVHDFYEVVAIAVISSLWNLIAGKRYELKLECKNNKPVQFRCRGIFRYYQGYKLQLNI